MGQTEANVTREAHIDCLDRRPKSCKDLAQNQPMPVFNAVGSDLIMVWIQDEDAR